MDQAYKQQLLKLLGAASLTTILYGALIGLLPGDYLVSLESHFGSRGGWLLAVLSWLPIMVFASLPAMYILKQQGVEKAYITAFAGDVLAFVLLAGYMLQSMFTGIGWWNVTLFQLVAIFASFALADFALRRWKR